jgi:hypothetical protein
VAAFPEKNPTQTRVVDRSFMVTTRTFNNASSGTFGQTIPGVFYPLQDYDFDGISGIAHGVRNTSTGSTGYRANVGAVNLGSRQVTMHVSVYGSDGSVLASQIPFILPPQGHVQDRLPVNVDHGSVEFFVVDPTHTAVVFPYVSVVDNRSGDPTYLSPTLTAPPSSLFAKSGEKQLRVIDSSVAAGIARNAEQLGKLTSTAGGKLLRAEAQ